MDITPAVLAVIAREMSRARTSRAELSRRSGIPTKTLWRLLGGQAMTLPQADLICEALGLSLWVVLREVYGSDQTHTEDAADP